MMQPHLPLARYGRFAIFVLLFILLLLATAVAAQEPVLPIATPDADLGLGIFAERCVVCHGPAGQGDGVDADKLEAPPADFTDPEFRRTRLPSEMFDVITNGRLASGMPPFGPSNQNDPLNDASRWNLVAAVYSLATPPEAIEAGQAIYEESCAVCHGNTGQGDGPEAAEQETPPTDLTDLTYWYNRSNEDVFNAIANEGIPAHAYDITDDERWAVVDYGRTLSYFSGPVRAVTVGGVVTNATTGQLVSGGDVTLRAFDSTFQLATTLTGTIGTDGSYTFNLTDVPADWIFLVGATYSDISFSSEAARLDRANPDMNMPITVFDTTTDSSVINIDQLHILLNFVGEQVQVDEFYVFSNGGTAVYVGENGDPDLGTLQLSLPEGAESVTFQRALGSMDAMIPANEVIQTDAGWADTLPLNPGSSDLNLIISYVLPYDGGASLTRPVHYQVTNANVILPAAGVSVTGEGVEDMGVQDMGGSQFAAFNRVSVPPGTTLELTLDGRPQTTTATGAVIQPRNTNLELIIGGLSLLVVVGLAVFTVRTWRAQANDVDDEEEFVEDEKEQLLQAIVELDEAFAAGEIGEADYTRQRAELKSALEEIWT